MLGQTCFCCLFVCLLIWIRKHPSEWNFGNRWEATGVESSFMFHFRETFQIKRHIYFLIEALNKDVPDDCFNLLSVDWATAVATQENTNINFQLSNCNIFSTDCGSKCIGQQNWLYVFMENLLFFQVRVMKSAWFRLENSALRSTIQESSTTVLIRTFHGEVLAAVTGPDLSCYNAAWSWKQNRSMLLDKNADFSLVMNASAFFQHGPRYWLQQGSVSSDKRRRVRRASVWTFRLRSWFSLTLLESRTWTNNQICSRASSETSFTRRDN